MKIDYVGSAITAIDKVVTALVATACPSIMAMAIVATPVSPPQGYKKHACWGYTGILDRVF